MNKHIKLNFSVTACSILFGIAVSALALAAEPMNMDHDMNPSVNSSKMMGSMTAMSHDMQHVPMTGNVDKDFVAMMVIHHQGAVDMAKVEVKDGHDAKLKAMAQKMIDDQTKEIKEMKDWQRAHK